MGSRRYAAWILILGTTWWAAPAARARCSTPVGVASASAAGSGFTATLTNPTSKSVKVYLGVAVTLQDGSTAMASIPAVVPAGGSVTAGGSFPVEIEQVTDTATCDTPPWGITESPEPVIVIQPPGQEEEDDGGTN